MVTEKENFGKRVRARREELQITLRKFSEMVGVSPTYISQIEVGGFKPPAEDVIRKIAKILKEDEDEMLALADKVPSDLPGIIQKHPREVATFLRTAQGFSQKQWEELTKEILKNPTGKGNKDK
jgi:HTH-type transcriptional regulator, competence development regulator